MIDEIRTVIGTNLIRVFRMAIMMHLEHILDRIKTYKFLYQFIPTQIIRLDIHQSNMVNVLVASSVSSLLNIMPDRI